MQHPLLYSFRRCPYAMRARIAIKTSNIEVELREVVLRSKPPELIEASKKATVPVLITNDGVTIDESLAIIDWALEKNDPYSWLQEKTLSASQSLIERNDSEFKFWLDRYKYFERYPEHNQDYYWRKAEPFLSTLETLLKSNEFLLDDSPKLADIAIFPFVRQFYMTDTEQFEASNYTQISKWLQHWLHSEIFKQCMQKYKPWQLGDPVTIF